jgi:hypothetical protein
VEFQAHLAISEEHWMSDICSSALAESRKERGTLIICETIEHANRIAERLKSHKNVRTDSVKLYTMNNMNQERQVEEIRPGETIIATNLAGRGTDINTKTIEASGGLHVMLTFMPANQRVEDQAFGRTARQGKRGTGQLVLNAVSLINSCANTPGEFISPQNVKEHRDKLESFLLDEFTSSELKLIQIKDKLFSSFCSFLNKIRADIRKTEYAQYGIIGTVKANFLNMPPSVYEHNVMSAIEERWAMFLMEIDDKGIGIDKADEEYEKLIGQIWTDYKEGQAIKNHFYNIAIGNDKIVAHADPKEALKYFKRAIEAAETGTEDSSIYGAAYAGIAWCRLLIKSSNYKHDALAAFNKALEILSTDMAMLSSMQAFMEQAQPPAAGSFNNSDLSKQLSVKTTLLGSYLNSIQSCVQVIRSSLRYVNMVKVGGKRPQLEQLYFDLEPHDADFDSQDQDENDESDPEAASFTENLKMTAKIKGEKKFERNAQYELIFNDLTRSQDSGVRDQALNTIEAAFKNAEPLEHTASALNNNDLGFLERQKKKAASLLKKVGDEAYKKVVGNEAYLDDSYSSIRLGLKQADLQSVRTLLDPNREFEELTGESAISVLKKERSFWDAIPLGKVLLLWYLFNC